jgi:predicted AlkP superfamily pyrophosphatase or phosphodiesterase
MRAALLACVLVLPAASPDGRVGHVVIVSIDGLRPEFYLGDWEAPTLKAMAREGVHAAAVESVFPSVTYPSHVSIVTGVRPWKHGIAANTLWGDRGGRREWHWWAKAIKARTLWQAAREKGLTAAVTYWPCTVGADVEWRVAEVWDPDGKETLQRLQAAATPGLLLELSLALGLPDEETVQDKASIDGFITGAACHVFRKHKPNLMLVHLLQVDDRQHQEGRESEGVRRAVREQDGNIARIRKAIEDSGAADRTLLIVTGDHGFVDVSRQLHPNALLAQAGLVEVEEGRVRSWKALAHSSGGSAAVYVKDPADVARVGEVLRGAAARDGERLYTVLDRRELDGLGYNAAASYALDAGDGFAFSGALASALVEGRPSVKGNHGQLPTREKLLTGFLAAGAGVKAGARVERMRLIDIAPTVARLLGLEMGEVEGAVLDRILE